MSTLSLEDLGPNMRRELGLEASCHCANTGHARVASIPVLGMVFETVVETDRESPEREARSAESPGAAWLRTGLHLVRIPRIAGPDRAKPTA